jgi:ABC-type multidrug transport system fused ATPase/permease subunit
VERVQTAVSAVLGEFLQQVFTFLFTMALVIALGGRLSWALLLFVPVVITSARKIGVGADADADRAGSRGGDSEHPARDDHRQSHREGFLDRAVGDSALQEGGAQALPRQPA